jgi:3-hydroxybutyryl-CoA dehydrogenase
LFSESLFARPVVQKFRSRDSLDSRSTAVEHGYLVLGFASGSLSSHDIAEFRVNVSFLDGSRIECCYVRASVLFQSSKQVWNVLRPCDGRLVYLAFLRVVLTHRRDVSSGFEVVAIEYRFTCGRRRDDDVGTVDCLLARGDRFDSCVESPVHRFGEIPAVLGCRREHGDAFDIPDSRRCEQLSQCLCPAADDADVARILPCERVDTDGTCRAGLVWVHPRTIQQRQWRTGLYIEQWQHEMCVAIAEACRVHVPAHRTGFGQKGHISGQHTWRVGTTKDCSWLGWRAVAALSIAFSDDLDVLGWRCQVRNGVAVEESYLCHGLAFELFAPKGLGSGNEELETNPGRLTLPPVDPSHMRTLEDIDTVGVVGAGNMGGGIAQVAAMNGYDVVMRDVEQEYVDAGMESIRSSLDRLVSSEKLTEDEAAETRDRLTGTTDLEEMADADVVVEAVVENMDVKKDVFAALDDITDEDVILATNTSTLSITSIASVTDRPGQVVGIHFMNPVPIMEGVEVVVGEKTDEETVAFAHEFSAALDKTTWESDDKPGFVVNRVLIPWINEGIRAYDEGVASKTDIDSGLKLGTNVPMGPLELADHVGLDICLNASETLHEELGDRYKPAYLLKRKVEAGELGKKTGKGFYEYEE